MDGKSGKRRLPRPQGIKAVLVARLKATLEATITTGAAVSSALPDPPTAASAERALSPSASPDPAALLAAFDLELSQELKSHLFARAIRMFRNVRG